jgi:hypothetical protein
MATLKKPLISAAALASAAAVAVATPAIVPSSSIPSPTALSNAQVNLTTFADLLSITPADWNYAFFTGWGGAIGPLPEPVPPPPVPIQDYWLPACNFDCTVPGVSGVLYLALDALINGNGDGIEDAGNWDVSAVNYFFEGGEPNADSGLTTGLQYILEYPFLGEPYREPGPLYNPLISQALGLVFEGPFLVTTVFFTALTLAAGLLAPVPFIGPYLAGGIDAYLNGYEDSANGLSGVLAYTLGTIFNIFSPPTAGSAASVPVLAAASGRIAALPETAPVVAEVASDDTTPAVSASDDTPADAPEAPESTPAAEAPESTPAAEAPETTPAVDAPESTPAETTPAVDAPESTPAAPEVDLPAAEVAESAPVKAPVRAPKRPVRDAVEKVTKQITSAIGGSRTAKAGAATAGAADASTE